MKNIDDLFKSVERLSPPDSLKGRVMEEIRAAEPVGGSNWRERLAQWLDDMTLHPVRMGLALATVALAVAVSTTFHTPKSGVRPEPYAAAVDINEINEFMMETIGPVYSVRFDANGTAAVEQEDVAEFVKSHVEPAFWINGGLDNA